MPLSENEIRIGILTNLRYNGMPINISYNNLDKLLNQLIRTNELTSSDNLYMPAAWTKQSNHDIEYLATFKKLRIYFVSHTFMFTDLDTSNVADITATFHNQRINIFIYSETSKFKKTMTYEYAKTYIAFLNNDKLEEFKAKLFNSELPEAEELKLYISLNEIGLINADSPEIVI